MFGIVLFIIFLIVVIADVSVIMIDKINKKKGDKHNGIS